MCNDSRVYLRALVCALLCAMAVARIAQGQPGDAYIVGILVVAVMR